MGGWAGTELTGGQGHAGREVQVVLQLSNPAAPFSQVWLWLPPCPPLPCTLATRGLSQPQGRDRHRGAKTEEGTECLGLPHLPAGCVTADGHLSLGARFLISELET